MINVFSDKIKDYLKQYLFIGGMPEVVETYVETKDFGEIRKGTPFRLQRTGLSLTET